MLRSQFSRHFQNAQADLIQCCGQGSFCWFCGKTNPRNEPENNNKGDPRSSRYFSKDKDNFEGQMFPPFSAEKELENNRQAHFVKRHALCHHPRWRTGCCLIQNGRPDMSSSKMADRI